MAFCETGAVLESILGAKKMLEVCNSLQVKVTVKNFDNPTIFVDLLDGKASKNSNKYKNEAEDAAFLYQQFKLLWL